MNLDFLQVARKLGRPATGLVAAWLLALNPLHILYSEEIRMYALLCLLALWFNDAAFRLLPRGRLVPAALLGSALAWTHTYGLVYAGVALGLVWLMEPAARRRAVTCVAWIVAAFLPHLGVFVEQLGSPHHVEWIVHFWRWYPGGFGILRSLQAFLPGGTKPSFLPLQGLPFQPLLLLFALLPVAWWLYRRRKPVPRAALTLPLAAGIATLGLLVVYLYATWPVYIAGRSDIVTLPAFLVPYAAVVCRGGGRFAPAHVAGLALIGLLELGGSATALRKEGNVEIAAAIAGQDCRIAITSGLAYASVVYAGLAGEHGATVRPYPTDLELHPGNFDLNDYPIERLHADDGELVRRHTEQDGLCLLLSSLPYAAPLYDAFLGQADTRYATVEDLHSSLLPGDAFVLVHSIVAPPAPAGRGTGGSGESGAGR